MARGLSTWLLIIMTGQVILSWIDKALEDGKVSIIEAADLITQLGKIWGFSVDLPVPIDETSASLSDLEQGDKPNGTGEEPEPEHRQTE